jgi:hypothetical protein
MGETADRLRARVEQIRLRSLTGGCPDCGVTGVIERDGERLWCTCSIGREKQRENSE